MDIEQIKRVISEQRQELEHTFHREAMIQRLSTTQALPFFKHPNIITVVGVRRSGKSTFSVLLVQQLQEPLSYINFDDERLISLGSDDLDTVLQAFLELSPDPGILVLDEVQQIRGWELFANRLRRTRKVIVTGSNSSLLQGEFATSLTGRHLDVLLYPFSFREILDFVPNYYLTQNRARVRTAFQDYLQGSGFPEFRKFGSGIITSIYQDIIAKDCLRRYHIKHTKTFKELALYLISNYGTEFTYAKLAQAYGLKDVHTAKNYVEYLKEAFIIVTLDRFSPKLKQQAIAPKKVYAIDHGFCNFIAFSVSPNKGRILENVVCLELLRKKALDYHLQVYYWKNHQQQEVDFILKEGATVRQLIQVCSDLENRDTERREIGSLLAASNELHCHDLLILTNNEEKEQVVDKKKIRYIPVWKWLLQ